MRYIRRLAATLMVLATFDIGWSAPAVSATSATSVTSAAAATRAASPIACVHPFPNVPVPVSPVSGDRAQPYPN